MHYAVTVEVSPSLTRCELTHLKRESVDVPLAITQHAAYRDLLCDEGWTVIHIPAAPDLPDSVFVEDTAVVTNELAIITRPGATSRRPETEAVANVLGRFREIVRIESPATIDGGDVLVVGQLVWVGLTSRTNQAGLEAIGRILEPIGYRVRAIRPRGCLHLKSAVTALGPEHVVVNPAWVDPEAFDGLDAIEVDPAEPNGANVLWLDGVAVTSRAFPRTRERLEERGIECRIIDVSELAKAEGALTCCSLLLT